MTEHDDTVMALGFALRASMKKPRWWQFRKMRKWKNRWNEK